MDNITVRIVPMRANEEPEKGPFAIILTRGETERLSFVVFGSVGLLRIGYQNGGVQHGDAGPNEIAEAIRGFINA